LNSRRRSESAERLQAKRTGAAGRQQWHDELVREKILAKEAKRFVGLFFLEEFVALNCQNGQNEATG